MRESVPAEVEMARVTSGRMASKSEDGFNGVFVIPRNFRTKFICIASTGGGWDHVSVEVDERGRPARLPTWEEMCWIKDLFFADDETVVEYHPPKSQYVNIHPWVLHLWRQQGEEMPLPPKRFV